jgi:hypothetical protein
MSNIIATQRIPQPVNPRSFNEELARMDKIQHDKNFDDELAHTDWMRNVTNPKNYNRKETY